MGGGQQVEPWLDIRLQKKKQPAGTAQAAPEGPGPATDIDQNRQITAEQVELAVKLQRRFRGNRTELTSKSNLHLKHNVLLWLPKLLLFFN